MHSKELIEKEFDFITIHDTLEQAIQKMDRLSVEVMPVFENNKPLGLLLKQDIISYTALKKGNSPKDTVSQIMRHI